MQTKNKVFLYTHQFDKRENNLRYIPNVGEDEENRNAHTTARENINCRTNLESILAKLGKFKDAYNQSYDPTTLLLCIYLRNSQMYTGTCTWIFVIAWFTKMGKKGGG